jgi:hypothetical protein
MELSVRVGEVTHQLRSAVDHIAHGLVVAAGNTPTRRTAFPVLSSRPTKLTIEGEVSTAALVAVDAFQPYQRRDSQAHPLYVLNRLWNIDKHRTLHLTVLQMAATQIFVGAPDGSAMFGGQFQPGPIGHDGIIGVFRFTGGEVDPDLLVEGTGQMFVALAETDPWAADQPVTILLEDLHKYVSQTMLPRFGPLLAGV